jgi:hypothetical protein
MAAPLVAGMLTFILSLASNYLGVPVIDPGDSLVEFSMGLAFSAIFVGVPITCFGAVPLFVWMSGRGPLSFRHTLWAGAVLAVAWYVLLIVAIPVVSGLNRTLAGDMRRMSSAFDGVRLLGFIAFLGVIGMGSAAAFWMISIRGTELDGTGG